MPFEIRFVRARGYLHATVRDPFTLEEIEEGLRGVTSSSQYPANVPTLWDLRGMDFGPMNRSALESIIAVRARHPERGDALLALVVDTEAQFGISRMYELLSESHDLPQRIQVFYSEEEALLWLLQQDFRSTSDRRKPKDGRAPSHD